MQYLKLTFKGWLEPAHNATYAVLRFLRYRGSSFHHSRFFVLLSTCTFQGNSIYFVHIEFVAHYPTQPTNTVAMLAIRSYAVD